ncbi:TlpA family protein disulfide reductase [Mucilaginibacter achroorhodeus]|uniref:TlpA family protein disulfide reductase n=1 Tax=Mucilaginibacter achroorhodeus TaxID=2599294 RepID=A0A563U5X6_9SPHI|nr:TlpA disulfide reductase family protein [Mucilaginibacter achroorhodeus]TWR26742.1 TlpA family protein disulfide reductase [Mucilaginibacter achroorhodeus]
MTEYEKSHPLDPAVRSFFLKDIKFSISNWIADYVDEGSNSSSDRAGRINLFRDPFFAINDDSNFVTMMYPYHLANFQYWKISEDSTVVRAKREGRNREALIGGIKLIQSSSTASISKDYMIFNYIEGFLKRAPSFTDSLPSLKNQFFDEGTYTYLERTAERTRTVSLPKTLISTISCLQNGGVTNTANADLIELLTRKYPGKVIYLDIYATWCGLCLKEMEFAPAIHHQFAGQDVIFVNLCMQSDEKKWKALVNDRKLEGEQYFLNADDTRLLMGSYNISGFPTYLLVNRSGRVTTLNAPRPSESQRLKREILKLLLTSKN